MDGQLRDFFIIFIILYNNHSVDMAIQLIWSDSGLGLCAHLTARPGKAVVTNTMA